MMSEATVRDMIQHALDQNFNKANDVFGEVMSIKIDDVLEQEKINLAGQIYNGAEEDDYDVGEDDGVDQQDDSDLDGEDWEEDDIDEADLDDETEDESNEEEED